MIKEEKVSIKKLEGFIRLYKILVGLTAFTGFVGGRVVGAAFPGRVVGKTIEREQYTNATVIVQDVNQDGREDLSIVDKDGKRIQLYLATDNGYVSRERYFDQERQKIQELEAQLK